MKKSTPLLMLLVTALVVGGIFWVRQDTGPGNDNNEVELFPFLEEEVERIVWTRGKDDVVEAEKRGEKWHLTKPVAMAADTEQIGARLHQAFRNTARREKDQVEAKVHGLDSPRLRVVLTARDGKTVALSFGNSLGAGRRIYARLEGNPDVLTVDEVAIFSAMNAEVKHLRDRTFVQVDLDAAISITVEHAGKTTTVRREGAWFVIEGSVSDLGGLRELILWERALTSIETTDWHKRDAGIAYGFDAPFARIVARLKDRTVTMAVGAPTEAGGYLRWAESSDFPGEVATIEEGRVVAAMTDPETLRAPYALPLDFTLVVRFRAACGEMLVEVAKEGGKWKAVKPVVQTDFDPERVEVILGMLSMEPARDRVPPVDPPADAVLITFDTAASGGEMSHEARMWRNGSDVFLRTENPARQLRLASSTLDVYFRAGEAAFRKAHVVDLVPMTIRQIRFEPDGSVPYDIDFDGQSFNLKTALVGKTLDKEKSFKLYAALSGLVVETWVREAAEDPATGLATPVLRITITPDPAKTAQAGARILLVGAEGPGGLRFARLEGQNGVFLLSKDLSTMLFAGPWK